MSETFIVVIAEWGLISYLGYFNGTPELYGYHVLVSVGFM